MSDSIAGLRERLRSAMNASLRDDPAEGLFDREGLTEDMLDIVMPIIEADLKAQIAGARLSAFEAAADECEGTQREKKWFTKDTREPHQIYNAAVCECADNIRKLADLEK